ncbi:HCNGP-like protein-domain-containing protein [Xylariales sp. PMI_506]|nr:HCNGP-like protein-domain-containing protein [Xylariales sp. PMI_506]
MAGLVGYESSDDEDIGTEPELIESSRSVRDSRVEPNGDQIPISSAVDPQLAAPQVESPEVTAASTESPGPALPSQPSIIGPMPQTEDSQNLSFPPLEDALMEEDGDAPTLPPGSPYSANRALLRHLTLPAVPNMDIPPSPPGSPLQGTNKKFEQFLELKKKGVHFNSKIAQSSALKNPSLMDKLLSFVEIDQQGQYRTVLGLDIWDPSAFPKAAYKEQLRQSQTEIGQAKARSKGGIVEFVAASRGSSRDTTPNPIQANVLPPLNSAKRKTRFDT